MTDMVEVFLPYAQGQDGQTMFEKVQAGEFKMLAHEDENSAG